MSVPPGVHLPGHTRVGEVIWLEPYPRSSPGERGQSGPGKHSSDRRQPAGLGRRGRIADWEWGVDGIATR